MDAVVIPTRYYLDEASVDEFTPTLYWLTIGWEIVAECADEDQLLVLARYFQNIVGLG